MKERTINIHKSDILFDVDAVTHVFADVNAAANIKASDASESDSGDTSNAALLTSFADARAAQLKERLGRFLKVGTETTTANAANTTGTEYTFSLYVENGFLDVLMGDLAHEMRAYISNGVIADWYAATGSQQSAVYAGMLAPSYSRIVEYIVKRTFPGRPSTT